MSHKRVKIAIAAAALALGLGFLAFAGMRKAQIYYMEVDAFLADSQHHNQRVRLCGTVAEDGLLTNRATLTTHFVLLGRQGRLEVLYKGLLPDMFRTGGDVVVEGKADQDGTFHSTQIMTKCASKYRPADYPSAEPPR
jgi:cytochrome c-type biogenesis protein CcmE